MTGRALSKLKARRMGERWGACFPTYLLWSPINLAKFCRAMLATFRPIDALNVCSGQACHNQRLEKSVYSEAVRPAWPWCVFAAWAHDKGGQTVKLALNRF